MCLLSARSTEHRSPSGWDSCLKTTEPRMKFSNGSYTSQKSRVAKPPRGPHPNSRRDVTTRGQRTSGPKDGGRGTRCGFSEIQACFSALVWLLTWCPEGRQTHYLWLLVRDFSDRVPRAAVRTRWRHKVFPKITERTRRSMIVSMDTARTLDRGPATRPTKPWSAGKCPEMGDSAQG